MADQVVEVGDLLLEVALVRLQPLEQLLPVREGAPEVDPSVATPEPLEEKFMCAIPASQQVVLFGHGRSFLSAVVTGDVALEEVKTAVARLNSSLPHYRQIRAYHIEPHPLTLETGLLTANGKLRRDAIAAHFGDAIESMYRKNPT